MNWLNNNKTRIIYLLAFLTILGLAYLSNIKTQLVLVKKLSESIFIITLPVTFFTISSFFLKDKIVVFWFKITNYYLVLSSVLILLTPTSTHGLDFFPIVRETMSIFLAIVYSLISLIIIIYKSLKKD